MLVAWRFWTGYAAGQTWETYAVRCPSRSTDRPTIQPPSHPTTHQTSRILSEAWRQSRARQIGPECAWQAAEEQWQQHTQQPNAHGPGPASSAQRLHILEKDVFAEEQQQKQQLNAHRIGPASNAQRLHIQSLILE